MDQTLYLAALLPVAYGNRSRPWRLGSFALLSGAFEVANLLGIPLYNSLLYPWTALVWVGWYVWASSGQSSELQCAESAHAVTSVS